MNAELIVLDLDGDEMLRRCLSSIERQSRRPLRVLIVDNGSRVPVSERIGASLIETKIIRSEQNLGFTGGINLAMAEVAAPLVGFINNDAELAPDWLSVLASVMEHDSELAAIQPIITMPDGRFDGAGIDVSTGRFLQIAHQSAPGKQAPAAWGVSATATLYRTSALREVSQRGTVLHPAFFAYYEDVELSARLRARGWQLRVIDQPLAVHAGSSSAPRLGVRGVFLKTRNRHWVYRLHHVGRRGALLAEDARLLVHDIVRFRLRSARQRISGVLHGLFAAFEPK